MKLYNANLVLFTRFSWLHENKVSTRKYLLRALNHNTRLSFLCNLISLYIVDSLMHFKKPFNISIFLRFIQNRPKINWKFSINQHCPALFSLFFKLLLYYSSTTSIIKKSKPRGEPTNLTDNGLASAATTEDLLSLQDKYVLGLVKYRLDK